MKKNDKPLEIAVCAANNIFTKHRMLMAWAQTYQKHGRVFTAGGSHAISCQGGEVPYDDVMKGFIHAVSVFLRDMPRCYFDIVKHSSGIEIIKLDDKRTYDWKNLLKRFVPNDKIPINGVLSSEKASFFVSMCASYLFYEHLKSEGQEAEAQAHAERYKALAKSQVHNPIIEKVLIFFEDFREEIISFIEAEENNKPAS